MINFRPVSSPAEGASRPVGSPGEVNTQALHQDRQGPLDGELLDLYVAILIAVPLACFLRYLWS